MDYEQLARFHYCGGGFGRFRQMYKLIDGHLWRRLAAPVVGVIVYGSPAANLAARNRAIGGIYRGLDRSAALSFLNRQMLCIRRVIIEPRYRGLGLASRLVAETLAMTGSAMVEAVSMMGRSHPFFERAGMKAFSTPPDAKTERMRAAFESAGFMEMCSGNAETVHAAMDALPGEMRGFIDDEMRRFCQKFTHRRGMGHCPERTGFVLSKLAARPVYYLWTNPRDQ